MQTLTNLGLNSTGGTKAYFIATDTGARLDIQFIPNQITTDRDADINTMKIVGRNTPKYQHTNGEDTMRLELDFLADEETRKSVHAKCKWLESLTYNDQGKKPAQPVILVFGDLFQDDEFIVTRVRTSYSNFHKNYGLMPQQAYVDIELKKLAKRNLGWDDVMPLFTAGAPDGQNPINLGPTPAGEDLDLRPASNNNNFAELLKRAAQNIGLLP